MNDTEVMGAALRVDDAEFLGPEFILDARAVARALLDTCAACGSEDLGQISVWIEELREENAALRVNYDQTYKEYREEIEYLRALRRRETLEEAVAMVLALSPTDWRSNDVPLLAQADVIHAIRVLATQPAGKTYSSEG